MRSKRNIGLTIGVLAMAFVGGVAGQWLLSGRPALAQNAPQGPVTITAERFELVDANGNTRGLFHVSNSGASMVMLDPNGATRLVTAVRNDGTPVVSVLDADGNSRALMSVGNNGSPVVSILDPDETPRAALGGGNGAFGVFAFDDAGVPRSAMVSTPTGAGTVVYDAAGRTRGSVLYQDQFDTVGVTINSAAERAGLGPLPA